MIVWLYVFLGRHGVGCCRYLCNFPKLTNESWNWGLTVSTCLKPLNRCVPLLQYHPPEMTLDAPAPHLRHLHLLLWPLVGKYVCARYVFLQVCKRAIREHYRRERERVMCDSKILRSRSTHAADIHRIKVQLWTYFFLHLCVSRKMCALPWHQQKLITESRRGGQAYLAGMVA